MFLKLWLAAARRRRLEAWLTWLKRNDLADRRLRKYTRRNS